VRSPTPSGLSYLLLAAVICLGASVDVAGQTANRSFQMALWPDTNPAVVPTPSDADIKTFWELYGQPAAPARSIAFLQTWQSNTPLPAWDWSRILAVQIDEPYATALIGTFGGGIDLTQNPCHSTAQMQVINATAQKLATEATMVKSNSPKTRFWVNFSGVELGWMMDSTCPLALNQPYIDVISVDHYRAPFKPDVQVYYDWFIAHPPTSQQQPQQQLALIPGTFFETGVDDPTTQATYLQGYFDYANSLNHNCNLALGSRGQTFNFDGCRVWVVMGWLAGNFEDYVGLLDSRSAPIARAWRQEARPTRGQILNDVVFPVVLSQ
jgi:hypothetical protein